MYCRLHGYPTAPLISYKITGIGRLWGFGVPLSELSTLVAQGPILGHYVLSSNPDRCNSQQKMEAWLLTSTRSNLQRVRFTIA